MTSVERMKQYLKDEYGIVTSEQLDEALRRVKPLNISLMVKKAGKGDVAK